MINFIQRGRSYEKILDSFIQPIIKHLPDECYRILLDIQDPDTLQWWYHKKQPGFDVGFFKDVIQRHGLFIPHGIADKCYRNADSMRMFDYVSVSGPLWAEKLINQGIDENRIVITGYAKLDPVFENYKKEPHNKIRVLYAPTHNAIESISSYPDLLADLEKLDDRFDIRISEHPANKENIEPTMNIYNWADVIIADSGSTVYEAWSLGIPVVFPDWLVKLGVCLVFRGSFEEYIYKNQIGYHTDNIHEMEHSIMFAAEHGLDIQTEDFIEVIFPKELRGRSGQVTADWLKKLG